ncbi:MAG TPA: gas vesicle protein [Nocardioidaceae bacterium]|nr:gas vesicle protein [Nocardioidaceae bacterium]
MTAAPPLARETPSTASATSAAQVSLVDLLDRLLGAGVVISGDVVISMAGVDLVQVRLNALVSSVRADMADPRQSLRRPDDA